MKTLMSSIVIVALALIAAPALDAAEPVVEAPAAQPALVDAPVVDTMCGDEKPAFTEFTAPEPAAQYCLDSGIECWDDDDCDGVCDPYVCTCHAASQFYRTCVYCP